MFLRNYKVMCFNKGIKYFSTNAEQLKNVALQLRQGKLRGLEKKLRNGTTYYSFKGIPYASPPVGKLRFKAPLPPEPWQGTRDAFEHGPICPQVEPYVGQCNLKNEDCLYLNVYTKTLERNAKVPVMVYIHGGAYLYGSGNDDIHGPEFLLQHDITLVTFNYRLEALGFLCLDTPEIPGNAGMKDQVAALRWVQENIEKFGGDPNNVTIFGESAGGTSVTYHLLSSMSNGLFHKVIAQSGVCISDWAQGKYGKDRAMRAAKYLGIHNNDVSKLTDLFQNVPVDNLVKLTFKSMTKDEKCRGFPCHFAPVVEKEFDHVEPFLIKEPLELLMSGQTAKVPLLAGYNSAEGLIMTKYELKRLEFTKDNLSFYVPREIANCVTEEKLVDFGYRIQKFYAGDRMTECNVDEVMILHSDLYFIYNYHRFLHFYSNFSESIYSYRFNCITDLNIHKKILGFSNYNGASHIDEIFYLFNNEMNKPIYEKQERLRDIIFMVTKLWTDFAKTGNPTPDKSQEFTWQRYTKTGKEYLNLKERPSMDTFAEMERVKFWNSLYKEAGLPHIADC
ncbi:PREDICTED: neuroligin 4-like [Papilio polytes]|uniref:neuroligin 4-like n=1 Tax=Papilio polytes TaxID=76194 RepID=UPI000675FD4B|nr:PREDICTED: neuroligin 4-like [Papilio polytes]